MPQLTAFTRVHVISVYGPLYCDMQDVMTLANYEIFRDTNFLHKRKMSQYNQKLAKCRNIENGSETTLGPEFLPYGVTNNYNEWKCKAWCQYNYQYDSSIF